MVYALPLRIDSVFDPALWETADSRDPQRIAAYLDVCKTLYIPAVDIAVNVTGRGSVKVAIARPGSSKHFPARHDPHSPADLGPPPHPRRVPQRSRAFKTSGTTWWAQTSFRVKRRGR